MTNTRNRIFKELLNIAPHVGKVSHTIYNVDFLKPFMCEKIEGNFTIKKVNDLVKNAGFNNAQIIAYMTDTNGYHKNWLNLVKITETDFYIETPIKLWKAGKTDNITTYYKKADFNETRKSSTAITYIIAQNKSDLTTPKTDIVDREARFKYVKHETYTSATHEEFITKVHVKRTDDTGSDYTINNHGNFVYTSELTKYRELSEIIDKSGYITQDKRAYLRGEAKRIRAEKVKKEYLETDHTAQIEALEEELKAKQNKLAEELKKAKTYEEVKATVEKISGWGGLSRCFYDIELLKNSDTKKIYGSNERINKDIEELQEKIMKL